jgi:hypothetical protein
VGEPAGPALGVEIGTEGGDAAANRPVRVDMSDD